MVVVPHKRFCFVTVGEYKAGLYVTPSHSLFENRDICAIFAGCDLELEASNMPTYKLVYFDAMGRAELARLIFAEAGVEYEDKRVPGDQWPAYKPSKYMLVPHFQISVLLCSVTNLY